MPSLFDPIRFGAVTAKNRILMAPLTRGRATREHVPTDIMAKYYAQRASAGLIISEAIGITQEGSGWPYAPGLWSDAQVNSWQPITQAVHDAGGLIFAQLWHMGRLVPSSVSGMQPVAPSASQAPGLAHTYDGKKPYDMARALRLDEIPRLLNDYEVAAKNALKAGFDGVQIHAANGYLIDEFIRDGANHRSDAYGGSPENRIRLLKEITERVIATVGADRTAVRLSPNGEIQGLVDSHPEQVFIPAAEMLSDLNIAFLGMREGAVDGTFGQTDQPKLSPEIRKVFKPPLVLNQDYTFEKAQAALDSGVADAISFGRLFIANPDLPRRFFEKAPLAKDVIETWYSAGAKGYTDYPFIDG
ncbi:MAG: alkene reductase [Zymomonas mobilis]|uniref:2,4-dienoyl-CoA reductase-like NADH-dependent reductase (Old Yellow Enzyme family) n=1 Tax=Zymomonas mobilis TaxID=542 RepID=A0A542VYU5_ZYMMB|nr:alkene reductase [Zymomonas mobilis]TQL16498.1 2,4-dienoyl-CoA reductase-like NADH-dependent reductase (Old Yellow Enzyme family) [Zymomonas mobilis]